VFKVPGATVSGSTITPRYFRVKIEVEALTEHFYPEMYLKKLELQNRPTELTSLSFPNIIYYDMVLGGEPLKQVHESIFEYSFTNVSSQEWTFYTLAMYQNNWGMTDHRKAEY